MDLLIEGVASFQGGLANAFQSKTPGSSGRGGPPTLSTTNSTELTRWWGCSSRLDGDYDLLAVVTAPKQRGRGVGLPELHEALLVLQSH